MDENDDVMGMIAEMMVRSMSDEKLANGIALFKATVREGAQQILNAEDVNDIKEMTLALSGVGAAMQRLYAEQIRRAESRPVNLDQELQKLMGETGTDAD